MKTIVKKSGEIINKIVKNNSLSEIIKRLKSDIVEERKSIPLEQPYSKEGYELIKTFIEEQTGEKYPQLTEGTTFEAYESLKGNIENYIGMTQVPTGVMGPIAVKGTAINESVYIPLATSEGALVASYHRGAKACTLSGGVTSICLNEAVYRSPGFRFERVIDAMEFMLWFNSQMDEFYKIVKQKSNHAVLEDVTSVIEGNQVIISFEYYTGDASGQNMVTICTQAICEYVLKNTPVKPVKWYIESNYSGDKKASSVSFSTVRGKKVTAECIVKKEIVESVLKSSPKNMEEYWKTSVLASAKSGTIGTQGHYANGLTAIFMACGQDVACISEASVGITRMEQTKDGDLYCSVTLPNLIVGTVGGGTGLPTQKECLRMLGCEGAGKSRRFAEICAALVLAGELSIAAAITEGHFTSAHQSLGR